MNRRNFLQISFLAAANYALKNNPVLAQDHKPNAQTTHIVFIDPATQNRAEINPAYLDSGKTTIRFLAQCDPHLAPFVVPDTISKEIERKMLIIEEDVQRNFRLAFHKYNEAERDLMNRAVCFAGASGRCDLNKLTNIMNQDLAAGGQFSGVLNLIACKPGSTAKDDLAKILVHVESHYNSEQIKEFYIELRRVHEESKVRPSLPSPAP